ncbi:MAG: bifunctional DNA-formamidopyrimidine glycosylase/DNA-(apurinic or apyrimidinic site) lyase [Aliifodinibius sp.]|nr:bifunctional DNA-formamidopyrimidine glycosylase/DNA-(apurinic or apyrimidinic site) lyase [Fodinibius sp.]
MPELPEVETIARTLRNGIKDIPGIVGKTITGADVYWPKTVAEPDWQEFRPRILGQKILEISRRAKYLVLKLDNDMLLIHLRMSGDLLVGAAGEQLADHVRLSLELDHEWQLAFNNPRKFGRVWLMENPDTLFDNLGPEPFDPSLTPDLFWKRLQGRKRQIKPLLMDQGFIAGLGNIYVDEALYLSKIHPQKPANQIESNQASQLLSDIRSVLSEGIRRNGASIDWVYRGGDFQNFFHVYQKTGEPCSTCGTPIDRIVVGQRGTHLCPVCQVI